MPIRSITHSKKSLKPGALAFMPVFKAHPDNGSYISLPMSFRVLECINKSGDFGAIRIEGVNKPQGSFWGAFHIPGKGMFIFPGDRGVRGYRYDSRAQQIFTTRKACKRAIKRWGGVNPNFIKEVLPGDSPLQR